MTTEIVLSSLTEEADPAYAAARERVLDWLDGHGRAAGVVFAAKPLALTASRDGRPVGGLIGSTNLGWLHVSLLAVAPEARRQGVGRKLLEAAEALARERGCHGAWLDTYDHQGPDYYPRLGWAKFGEIPDFPMGGRRLFFRKVL
jgi:GNAT superfamily N-acetyltransferase